ncbi:hypothetical protein ACHQM5_019165 [Ranunculus cassubicifolius]
MAEMALQVVVAPLLGVIFDNISSPIVKQIGLLWGVNEELEKLSSALSTIRLEVMQITDVTTQDWLRRLKEAAYEADDIIDECSTQVRNSSLSSFDLKHLKLRRALAKRIKKITAKFDGMASERDKFHLRGKVLVNTVDKFKQYRETSSGLCEDVVYGRDGDKKAFISILVINANSGSNLQVYPIVGIGGLGKTTLAQIIFNNESIIATFATRIWVCVSEDFSVKRVTKMIIASISGNESALEDLDPLQNHLKELLNGKKFLLVLDDVWNENPELWDKLRFSLKCGANGSSVIVTTRDSSVAMIMGTHPKYELTPLSDEDSWNLFKGRAFGMESEENGSLEAIGKQIVKKCGGVPLAAKALGGSLCFEHDVSKWESVRDNEIWELKQEEVGILPSLRLSYDRLTSYLRQCFVYCCMFPKDYEIEVKELIQLWIANGFVQTDERMEVEDAGTQMYSQLVRRSFLQDVQKNRNGTQICKMHDLMHDLACSVARNECYAFKGGDKLATIPRSVRHLWITGNWKISMTQASDIIETLSKSQPLLRTCLFFGMEMHGPHINTFFKNLTCLRALHLRITKTPKLPRSIGKMIHLRHLDLSHSQNEHLPKSICSLQNLRLLKLSYCKKLQALPKSLSKLINLRHLELNGCDSLIQLPDGIGELINLRHLDLHFNRRLIQLPNQIIQLINLRHLNLYHCTSLIQLPDGIGELINLRHLDLSSCSSLIQLPEIGESQNLRVLKLHSCISLIQMPVGNGRLLYLETLGLFVVGTEQSGRSITEMRGLNHLRGDLEIKGLEHVKDGAEAKQANLAEKQNLSSLSLRWGDIHNNCEDVIEGLLPPLQSLSRFSIWGYGGSTFPSWMKLLANLVDIQFVRCPNSENLPHLGHLPLLKKISIMGMDSLVHINKEFHGTNSSSSGAAVGLFPSLEVLSFRKMPNWEDWHAFDNEEFFPCLKKLYITSCPKLALLPLRIQQTLQELEVDSCEKLVVTSFPCLRVLKLECVSSFPVVSLQNLDALESLKFGDCNLASIPQEIENLSSLKSLKIKSFPALKSLSQFLQHQSSLEILSIRFCKQLVFSRLEFQHLTSLQCLTLKDLPMLTSLPELYQCSTLQILRLIYCDNLRVLPQWLQNLTSLRTLHIVLCHPDLHERCKRDVGEYWLYISHIQSVDISPESK